MRSIKRKKSEHIWSIRYLTGEIQRTGSAGRCDLSTYEHVPGSDDLLPFDITSPVGVACSDAKRSQRPALPVRLIPAVLGLLALKSRLKLQ